MFKKLNQLQLSIVLSLVIFGTTVVGYLYTSDIFVGSSLWISSGFVVGFYIAFKNKAIPGMLIGLVLANTLARIFLNSDPIILSIFLALILSFAQIFEAYLFDKLMSITKSYGFIKLSNSIYYIGIALIVSLVTGVICSTFLLISMDFSQYFITILRWTIGDFSGIIIFGTIILYCYYYDEDLDLSKSNASKSAIFLIVYVGILYLLFSNTFSWFQYSEFSFLLVAFFIIMSFAFSYRMILVADSLFFVMFQISIFGTETVYTLGFSVFRLNLYLFILSTSAALIKMILFELDKKNSSLEDANLRLGDLIDSTKSLFQLSDDLLDSKTSVHEDYFKRIFRIASTVFEGFDYASCYIKENPYIHFIDSIGYQTDELNSFNFLSSEFLIDTESPVFINQASKTVNKSLPNNYSKFIETNPIIAESIRFGIFIDEELIGGMSFDITQNSDKHFNQFHFESYKSFQKLMNSFFSINYLNYKNQNLKNDIVLSLIRTLELYDHYTGGHSEDVAYLSGEVAKIMHLKESEVHDIYWAGIVHDIGKVGINSSIINKPSKLTLEEYEIVKSHPVFGYDILSKSEDLSKISLLVRHHHEWWNGAGYPDGLIGSEIPIGAQIIGVCDAVSSMATKRSYTLVRTSEQIIEELKLYSGTQFSPLPTNAMIEFIQQGKLDEYYSNRNNNVFKL